MNECQGLNDHESSKKGVSSAQFFFIRWTQIFFTTGISSLPGLHTVLHWWNQSQDIDSLQTMCYKKYCVLGVLWFNKIYRIMKFISIIITYTGKYSWAVLIWQGTKFLFYSKVTYSVEWLPCSKVCQIENPGANLDFLGANPYIFPSFHPGVRNTCSRCTGPHGHLASRVIAQNIAACARGGASN